MFKLKSKGRRCSWSVEETKELLALMKDRKVMEQLEGKTRRNKNVYVLLANELAKKGFSKNSDQVKIRFRTLKKDFLNIKRSNSKSGAERKTMNHFEQLNELLGDRPIAAAVGLDTAEVEEILEDSEDLSMTEDCLEVSFAETDESNKANGIDFVQQNGEQGSKKRRSAIQTTLLQISADIKESQQSVLKMIKEENKSFIAEERRLHLDYIKDMKEIMAEDRKETKEMLLEILNR